MLHVLPVVVGGDDKSSLSNGGRPNIVETKLVERVC